MVEKHIKTVVNTALYLANHLKFCLWKWVLERWHFCVIAKWKGSCPKLEESCNTGCGWMQLMARGEAADRCLPWFHVCILFLAEEIRHRQMWNLHYDQIYIMYSNYQSYCKKLVFQKSIIAEPTVPMRHWEEIKGRNKVCQRPLKSHLF